MWWKIDRFGLGVDQPTEQDLSRGPSCVALFHFLDRGWFLAILVIGFLQRLQCLVENMLQGAFDVLSLCRIALS